MAYDIRLVKLISGETVIGKFSADGEKIEDPAILQTVPSQQGMSMMLLPFGYPFDAEMGGEVATRHVIYEYKACPEELKTKYLEACTNLTLSGAAGLGDLTGAGGTPDLSQLLKK